jgi:hypothetical protein
MYIHNKFRAHEYFLFSSYWSFIGFFIGTFFILLILFNLNFNSNSNKHIYICPTCEETEQKFFKDDEEKIVICKKCKIKKVPLEGFYENNKKD